MGQETIAILALRREDPISAFYKNHPGEYFKDIDLAYVEPKNPVVARLQLMCAAMDKPLELEEFPAFRDLKEDLAKKGFLEERSGKLHATNAARKEIESMNIRGIGETVSILDVSNESDPREVGDRQMPMALRELFPGAVYLLGGKKFESTGIKVTAGAYTARVKRLPDSHRHKTEALRYSDPRILEVLERRLVKNMEVLYCSLMITEIVEGYHIREIFSDKMSGQVSMLKEPLKHKVQTKGFVFVASKPSAVSGQLGTEFFADRSTR